MSLLDQRAVNGASPNGLTDIVVNNPKGGGGSTSKQFLDTGVNSAIDIIDRATGLPKRISDLADELNDKLIQITTGGKQVIEENLKDQKVAGIGKKIARMVQDNPIVSIIIVVVAIIIIRRV